MIALEPNNHAAYFMRGKAYYDLGQIYLAESDWENALKLAKEADNMESTKFYEAVLHELKEKRR